MSEKMSETEAILMELTDEGITEENLRNIRQEQDERARYDETNAEGNRLDAETGARLPEATEEQAGEVERLRAALREIAAKAESPTRPGETLVRSMRFALEDIGKLARGALEEGSGGTESRGV